MFRPFLLVCHNSTSKQSASDNGTRATRSPRRSFYLVHISVRAASYPLDQLEILLRIPPRQVDTGVHHVRCRSRRRARTTEKRQRYTKTGILRKNIRRQKIPAQIQCRSNMASVCCACALGSMAPLESDQAERSTVIKNEVFFFFFFLMNDLCFAKISNSERKINSYVFVYKIQKQQRRIFTF